MRSMRLAALFAGLFAVTATGACASEQANNARTLRTPLRRVPGAARCTHAIERLALAGGTPGDFLVVRGSFDGYALALPAAGDWEVRCAFGPEGPVRDGEEALAATSVSRRLAVRVAVREPREVDEEGRLVASEFLRSAMRAASTEGAVGNAEIMNVSGTSVAEYVTEGRDESEGQRVQVRHARAARLRGDGYVLDLDLRSFARTSEETAQRVLLLRYAAASFVDSSPASSGSR